MRFQIILNLFFFNLTDSKLISNKLSLIHRQFTESEWLSDKTVKWAEAVIPTS